MSSKYPKPLQGKNTLFITLSSRMWAATLSRHRLTRRLKCDLTRRDDILPHECELRNVRTSGAELNGCDGQKEL